MDGFAERIFPIRIFVDPEAERLRISENSYRVYHLPHTRD